MGIIRPNPGLAKSTEEENDDPAFEKEEIDDDEEVELESDGDEIELEDEEDSEDGDNGGKDEEETPAYTFKTQKELDDYIASKQKANQPLTPPKKESKEEEEDEDEFKDLVLWKGTRDDKGNWIGEAPADWNDFARTILRQLAPKVYAPKILQQIQKMSKADQEEIEAINAGFDAEYDELAAQGLVPKRGTKEGDLVNTQISTVGSKYGQTSIKSAYELWRELPKEKGGAGGTAPTTKKVNPNKKAAMLNRSSKATQTASRPTKKIPYNKLHGARSATELIDDEE